MIVYQSRKLTAINYQYTQVISYQNLKLLYSSRIQKMYPTTNAMDTGINHALSKKYDC